MHGIAAGCTQIIFVALVALPLIDCTLIAAEWRFIRGRTVTNSLFFEAKNYFSKSHIADAIEIATDANEFANGNTIVRLVGQVTNQKVIVLSEFQTSNDIMEALMSVRTARTQGASEIHLITARKPDRDERGWIFQAGADSAFALNLADNKDQTFIRLKEPTYRDHRSKKNEKRQSSLPPIVVSLTNHGLGREIANKLKIKHFWNADSIRTVLNKQSRYLNRAQSVVLVSSPSKDVNGSFLKLLRIIRELKKEGAVVTTVTPYLPYARSDKIDQAGVTVGGRLIADLIENAGTDRIAFVRLHAPQSQGFFTIPSIHIDGRRTIDTYLASIGVQGIVSPDAGFQKEAALYARELNLPVFVINKYRDPVSGKSELESMGRWDLKGMNLAIVDDETLTGGSLSQASDFVVSSGAENVVVVVTHLTGDAKHALENSNISQLVTTNTFEIEKGSHQKLKVLSIADELAEALAPHLSSSCKRQFRL
jgi:ribose-phosphate pyrophosphokinase